jgi:hypothetical protein
MTVSPVLYPDSVFVPIELSNISLSVASTVMSTSIIALRIIRVSAMSGTTSRPRIVVKVIVESATLYAVSAMVYIFITAFPRDDISAYGNYAEFIFANMAVRSNYTFKVASSDRHAELRPRIHYASRGTRPRSTRK